jgi:ribosome-associated heat shock protein Hsp15
VSQSARIDKWLFCARFYRSRALAQAAASSGRLRLNGRRVEKPGQCLRPGDILTLGLGGMGPDGGASGKVLALKVLMLAERRGPAAHARTLYAILE